MTNPYDRLAFFYNKYWTTYAPELFGQVLDEYFLPHMPENAAILDLCCGTGQVCAKLSADGYNVTGLDYSEKMLEIARQNAPKADFVQADARYFMLSEKYDAVLSLFDSVNHLLSMDDMFLCFQSVRAALKPGGLFMFDVNDDSVFTDVWENGFSMVEDDNICILKPTLEPGSMIAAYNITMLQKLGGAWEREDTVIYEQCYSPQEIVSALDNAGFNNIRTLDGEQDLGITQFAGRLFFIAS